MIWVTSFEWIERIFGYGGLCMLVFAVAAVKLGPDWGEVAKGFIPHVSQNNPLLYAYFVVGLLGAAMTPYEVYFYSSGGVEERMDAEGHRPQPRERDRRLRRSAARSRSR